MTPFLDYYAAHECALFPIPAGQKDPTGIVASFERDSTNDPAQWAAWSAANPNCNWGVVAGKSRLIIVDVDVGEVGRDRAWAEYAAWCTTNGLPVYTPQVQSARGGWHVMFRVPDDLDCSTLRQTALVGKQPDTKKAIVDTRVYHGYVVAAGSWFEEKQYAFMSQPPAAPYAAPQALLDALVRVAAARTNVSKVGTRDREDVAKLVDWLHEREQFHGYEQWINLGMALKLEYGDDGYPIWQRSFTDASDEAAMPHWDSFSYEPESNSVTLATFVGMAKTAGCPIFVRESAAAKFATVVGQGVAASGGGAIPMMAGQAALAEIGTPILAAVPDVAPNDSLPSVPKACASPLRDRLNAIMPRLAFEPDTYPEALAVLAGVHGPTFDELSRRYPGINRDVIDGQTQQIHRKVLDSLATYQSYRTDDRGRVDHGNSDNVRVFCNLEKVGLRWNEWLERVEIKMSPSDWAPLSDDAISTLRARAASTSVAFRPSKDFFADCIRAISRENRIDPVLDWLAAAQEAWDGVPRLLTWLTHTTGVPCDLYHQAVARNLIGGIVRRARQPGCKHDTMVVLSGPQGVLKSTLAGVLAIEPQWFTDGVALGDESKELLATLAGKLVAEISELHGARKRDVEAVKSMLSKTHDHGRRAYGRFAEDRPRRNIFIGTTNQEQFLADPTGSRRFLPVRIAGELNIDWLRGNLTQLIGEAAHLEAHGDTFAIPREVWGAAAEHQEAAREESAIEPFLQDWFAGAFPGTYALPTDIQIGLRHQTGRNVGPSEYSPIMRRLGFSNAKTHTIENRKTRPWVKGSEGPLVKKVLPGAPSGLPYAPTASAVIKQVSP